MKSAPAPMVLKASVDDAIATIRAYVQSQGWSIYRLAKEAQLPRSSLRFFNEPAWSPKSDTLRILYAIVPRDFDPSSIRVEPPVETPKWPKVVKNHPLQTPTET